MKYTGIKSSLKSSQTRNRVLGLNTIQPSCLCLCFSVTLRNRYKGLADEEPEEEVEHDCRVDVLYEWR